MEVFNDQVEDCAWPKKSCQSSPLPGYSTLTGFKMLFLDFLAKIKYIKDG